MRKQGSCLEKELMQGTMPGAAGEEDHARPGSTTSRRGQDSLWKSQSEWQRTEINGESTSMVWPTLGSRTAKEQNRAVVTIIRLMWTSTFRRTWLLGVCTCDVKAAKCGCTLPGRCRQDTCRCDHLWTSADTGTDSLRCCTHTGLILRQVKTHSQSALSTVLHTESFVYHSTPAISLSPNMATGMFITLISEDYDVHSLTGNRRCTLPRFLQVDSALYVGQQMSINFPAKNMCL